ncbi:MAG: class I SAM-dependent methyltransferase [Phycisphaera sp.]|nr:MAG: class I SAM-dependent methyltransferase [Phycisphaera sp.]
MTPARPADQPLGYRNTSGRRVEQGNERASPSVVRSRLWRWLMALSRTRRIVTVQGVRYEELDAVPLRRALSRGMGKRYRVRFPDRAKMVLEVSGARPIADLLGAGDLGEFTLVDPLMRPGDRVLLLHAGTGHGAAWLSDRLGPTGALVALEPDAASVRYARHRYHPANTALEVCDLHSPTSAPPALIGELDGAFDAIVHRRLPGEGPQRDAQLAECWRLLCPGGVMSVLLASPSGHHDPREDPRLRTLEEAVKALSEESGPGFERMERVRVHARCGLLVQRGYEDEDVDDDDGPGPVGPDRGEGQRV